MKCPKCGNDLFPNQFRCERCGANIAIAMKQAEKQAKAEKKSEPKKATTKKEK